MHESDLEVANKTKVNSGFTKRFTLRLGKITAVYPDDNTADVQWIFPNVGGMAKLELSKPYVGFQSGIHFIPQVGSLVTVGFAEDLPILLTYFMPTTFSNMLSGLKNNSGQITRIRKLNEGEISINSVQDAEIYIHDSIEMRDNTNDSIVINPTDGSITLDSLQLYIENEAGQMTMGMVVRNGEIITDDGQPVTTENGGNALTEFNISINKFADNTINVNSQENEPIAEITIGTLVDEEGKIVKNQIGKNIVCEVRFSSGATLQIDETGKFNVNEGNMIKPTDASTRATAAALGAKDKFTPSDTQQRAAREGDRVVIPITAGQTDLDHPNLNAKAASNIASLAQIAPMFLVYGIPAVFVPSVPNTKLVGEITQGSDSFFIGSLDKSTEKNETSQNT